MLYTQLPAIVTALSLLVIAAISDYFYHRRHRK